MEIREIIHVRCVATFQNITKAAEFLHITQPSLSQSIKLIEKKLQLSLFHRSKKGMTLTEEGRAFVRDSEPLIQAYEMFLSKINQYNLSEQYHIGLFKLSYTTAINDGVMNFISEHSDDNYMIKVESIDDLEKMLLGNQLDVAIVKYTPIYKRNPKLHYEMLFKEPLYCILSSTHPLSSEKIIDAKSLSGNALITSAPSEYPYKMTEHILKEAGITLEIHTMTNYYNLAMILDLVEKNMGVGFASEKICQHFKRPGIRSIPLSISYDYEVCIVTNPNQKTSVKILEFIEYLKEYVASN
ncbi:MAG: LysR family transcriptional regulator [Clostridia bacterium]|nr:LysR family transcriptional regulator [Clostridia bacterium]